MHLLFSPLCYSNEAILVENPVLLQADCYRKLVQTRLTNMLKKAHNGNKPTFRVGQYVLLKNDNLRTIQGSHQLIAPICRDIYQVISVEKGGFSFRILNTRNRAERTVIFTELRQLDLDAVMRMELDPKKFIQNMGKIIRHNSFKRGNNTALRLLDLSEGKPNSQTISQQQPPPLSDPEDKKCPSDEEFLLTKLDTENVEQDITDEVGSLFSNQPAISNEVHRSNNSGYNLRRSPRPSVRLHSIKLDSPPDIKSILKPGYRFHHVTIKSRLSKKPSGYKNQKMLQPLLSNIPTWKKF